MNCQVESCESAHLLFALQLVLCNSFSVHTRSRSWDYFWRY